MVKTVRTISGVLFGIGLLAIVPLKLMGLRPISPLPNVVLFWAPGVVWQVAHAMHQGKPRQHVILVGVLGTLTMLVVIAAYVTDPAPAGP